MGFGFGSGVIKGKGTDDEVKMGLQKGAYVMPADSTEQIGAEQLGALGKGFVPAHVSNGEYHLPPEQVHGLGVQVLDAMKNATHNTQWINPCHWVNRHTGGLENLPVNYPL